MRVSAARFGSPLTTTRPRGARLLEAHSPRLGRSLTVRPPALSEWIRLEADPAVLTFCRRSARLDSQRDSCLIDFWIQRAGGQSRLLLESRCDLASPDINSGGHRGRATGRTRRRAGVDLELESHAACHQRDALLAAQALIKSVCDRLQEPKPLTGDFREGATLLRKAQEPRLGVAKRSIAAFR